jgi:hypothetical protein
LAPERIPFRGGAGVVEFGVNRSNEDPKNGEARECRETQMPMGLRGRALDTHRNLRSGNACMLVWPTARPQIRGGRAVAISPNCKDGVTETWSFELSSTSNTELGTTLVV